MGVKLFAFLLAFVLIYYYREMVQAWFSPEPGKVSLHFDEVLCRVRFLSPERWIALVEG